MSILDREYLEDYRQKEASEFDEFCKRIREGSFSFEKDRFPFDERFWKLQRPVALTTLSTAKWSNIWAQVPFSGSLILKLPPYTQSYFEETMFKVSEIPRIIDFIKETGRLQVALVADPLGYGALDYLDPFFKELKPPVYAGAPIYIFGTEKEIQKARHAFYTLASVRFLDRLKELMGALGPQTFEPALIAFRDVYTSLKLGRYTVVEDIENLMIDDPGKAIGLFNICELFIVNPLHNTRVETQNLSLGDVRKSQTLPAIYHPEEMQFPCEIGKFLLRKLTYAAQDIRACYCLMDNYDAYDLRKVQESLNSAIAANHSDIVNKSSEALSEILDNVWNDPTIPRQIKNVKRGVPISIAAIGSAVSALTGGLEGFLAGLGFSVGSKFLDFGIERLAEKLVKFFARSYQANVYDFKKKYKGKIAHP